MVRSYDLVQQDHDWPDFTEEFKRHLPIPLQLKSIRNENAVHNTYSRCQARTLNSDPPTLHPTLIISNFL